MADNDHSSDASQSAIERVISNFVNGLPGRLTAIRSAITAAEWGTAQHLSHKLAGAAIFGFPELGAAAHRLEHALEDGDKLNIPVMLAQVEDLVAAIEQGAVRGDALALLR